MSVPRTVLALLFFLFAILVNAQKDTTNIKSYADQVMIRANLDTNIESFIFSEGEEGKEKQQIFTINNKTKVSLSVDYKIISATHRLRLSFFQITRTTN
ncbi:hypothetical protein EG359_14495 [Chryseobacterium joostei]|uniref:Uncharacterized protein n=1 Tax=Chryseobacterium joostei TaxID=112234 RepID=A0A1N7I787_9FLAO|nr:hypothetical protein [Chryseobacterium joostei]AZB00744.1 hypothetical protein EG359_14495 [Chryseobacterium joostei]SIS32944.1 hypothetical protein SAMN05421768_10388 [Chryseobacterium joostei]